MAIAERPRRLVTDGSPTAIYPVPDEAAFESENAAFLPADDLRRIGAALIAEFPYFSHLRSARIVYLWKAKGGQKGGKNTLGTCQKPSGLLRHFSDADFVVCLSADHLSDAEAPAWQVEATLHHELLHAWVDSESGKYVVRPHEWEGFGAEIERYGAWDQNLRDAARAFKQLGLGLDGATS